MQAECGSIQKHIHCISDLLLIFFRPSECFLLKACVISSVETQSSVFVDKVSHRWVFYVLGANSFLMKGILLLLVECTGFWVC